MKLIFVNRFFHPDHSATSQMLSDLALAMCDNKYPVNVITSRQRYDCATARLAPNEAIRGVQIRRIWTSQFGRKNLVGRAIDYFTFYISATWALFRFAQTNDIIIAKTDPPMLSVVVGPVARW